MKLEEAIKKCEKFIHAFKKDDTKSVIGFDVKAIETVLQTLNNHTNSINKLQKEVYKENKKCSLLAIENNDLKENSIPKKKIEDKIDKLIKIGNYRTENNPDGRVHFREEPCDYQIQILQELLEED